MTRGQRKRYGAAIGVMALGILLLFFVPEITRGLIDGFEAHENGGTSFKPPAWLTRALVFFGLTGAPAALLLASVTVVIVTLIAGSLQYLRGRWAAVASEAIMRQLRNRLFSHLNALPLSFFESQKSGDLVQRCTSDVETVRTFLSAQVVEIGRSILLLVFVTPILFRLDTKLALVTLSLAPVVVVYSVLFFGHITRIFRSVDEAEGRLTGVLQENLTGIRVVRSFGRQAFEEAKFATANDEHKQATCKLMRLLATFWSVSDFICMSQGALVLFFGAYWTLAGDLSLGTLVAFTLYSAMVIWPVRQMGRTLVNAGKARVSLRRINEILAAPPEETEHYEDVPAELSGKLEVEHLRFAFPNGEPVVNDISFTLEAGASLAIVGPPGSGKSMIVELLLRLHDYKEGQRSGSIRFDGHELSDLPQRLVRRNIAVVMQSPFLYAKTIAHNLRVGHAEANMVEILTATSAAAVHESIDGFEHGYDTLLGERGVTLSGGQKQRIAIARALLKEAPLLILDDALSAVDLDTEARILAALRERNGKSSTILIAHRLSSVRHADLILVLNEGRIVERGSHRELLAANGRYAHLWHLQTNLQLELKPQESPERP